MATMYVQNRRSGFNPLGLIGMAANVMTGGALTPFLALASGVNSAIKGDWLGAGLSALGGASSGLFGKGIADSLNNGFGNLFGAKNTTDAAASTMPAYTAPTSASVGSQLGSSTYTPTGTFTPATAATTAAKDKLSFNDLWKAQSMMGGGGSVNQQGNTMSLTHQTPMVADQQSTMGTLNQPTTFYDDINKNSTVTC